MNNYSLDDEMTRIHGAVSDEDIKRRSSQKRSSGEWVTAANLKVKERQLSEKNSRQNAKNDTQKTSRDNEKGRDVLAEFSSPDGYTRGKTRLPSYIDENDTEAMTAQRKKVSDADIERRKAAQEQKRQIASAMAQGARAPQSKQASALRPQIQTDRRQGGAPVQSRTPQQIKNGTRYHGNSPAQKSGSEWTSVKNASQSSNAKKGVPSQPSRSSNTRTQTQSSRQIRDINRGRAEKKATPPPQKRIFTPIEAEEIILKEPTPKRHTISPFTGIFILVAAILSAICIILCVSMSTKITKISVKTEDTAHINEGIIKVCEEYKGKSYLTFDSDGAVEKIKGISALVADVKISGAFPRKLHVSVTYDTPRYYAVDERGVTYVTSSTLKVLHICESDSDYNTEGLTKLVLPSFTAQKVGQTIEFAGIANYVRTVTDALADYSALGHISYISFANTQRIYFIFDGNFRCDLGNSSEIELKLKAAETTFLYNVLPALGENTERTALINVSTPSSATYRLDAELGVTE